MKFFHLSDLHIGLKLINRDLSEDQAYVLRKVVGYAKEQQPDAVVIAGDIYDKAIPSAEAVTLFDRFVTELTEAAPNAEIMMISGNHDSAPRINVFRGILNRRHIHMVGLPPQKPDEMIEKVTLSDEYGPVNFYLLPFVKPSMVKAVTGTDSDGNNLSYEESIKALIKRETLDTDARNVLVSHQFYLPAGSDPAEVERMDSEIRTVGNIDAVPSSVLAPFDYAALGHIHKPMNVGSGSFRYCGTPFACSVSEAGQKKGVILVELGEKGSVKTTVLPLEPLHEIRKIRGTQQEVLDQHCNDYVSVILTDSADLNSADMQDRMRYAFPNLLEIRREPALPPGKDRTAASRVPNLSPLELCREFLQDLGPEEALLLEQVINTVQEAKE